MTNDINTPLKFTCGATMKNRFMLAPMTNQQSHADGRLSEDEFKWLTMRAKGGFGLVMTCASHVQKVGQGFPGQLGIFSDEHIPGHERLASEIQSYGSLAVIQLHHAGMRSPSEVIGEEAVCPSRSEKHGARALSYDEVIQLRDDFISAAIRAKNAGYDGVEVHGAHGYILTQFISEDINNRTDKYGGSLENRSRILFEIIDGIRESCGKEFLLGVRLSPERFGMKLFEIKEICLRLVADEKIDFLDISLWDSFKLPEEEAYKNRSLLKHFAEMEYKNVKLTVAGKIKSGSDVQKVMKAGVDFVTIGRAAILHHDFPNLVIANPNFIPVDTPVSKEHLITEGLSETFIQYMGKWPGFVED